MYQCIKYRPSGKVTASVSPSSSQPDLTCSTLLYPLDNGKGESGISESKGETPPSKPLVERDSVLDRLDKPRGRKAEDAPRGSQGITQHGADLVRDAAAALEKKYGKENLSFLTATIAPGEGSLASEFDKKEWSRKLDLFKRWLEQFRQSVGLPGGIIGVTELQQKRYERTGETAYHIHWLFVGRHPGKGWAISAKKVAEKWDSLFNSHSSLIDEGKNSASVNLERVKKSVGAYMGKYLSKGKQALKGLTVPLREDQLPSAWYICTKPLRELVTSMTVVLKGLDATMALNWMVDNSSRALNFHRTVWVMGKDGKEFAVGWYGFIKMPVEQILAEALNG